jgi:hypothetical protein
VAHCDWAWSKIAEDLCYELTDWLPSEQYRMGMLVPEDAIDVDGVLDWISTQQLPGKTKQPNTEPNRLEPD